MLYLYWKAKDHAYHGTIDLLTKTNLLPADT